MLRSHTHDFVYQGRFIFGIVLHSIWLVLVLSEPSFQVLIIEQKRRFIAEIYLKILPRHEMKYCNGTEEMIEQRCKMEKYRVDENPRKVNKSKIENFYIALRN